jgi:group I intron endonuclease
MSTVPRFSIYIFHNTVDHKAYIGQTRFPSKRHNHHIGLLKNGNHTILDLQKAWNEHRPDIFEFEIVEQCQSQQEADEAETFWIEYLRFIGVALYNIRAGGRKGVYITRRKSSPQTEEHKRNIGRASLGRTHTEEAKAKVRAAKLGKKRPEVGEKIGQTLRAKPKEEMARLVERRIQARIKNHGYTYCLVSPSGEQFIVDSISRFCKEHGISKDLYRVVAGKRKQCNGWTGWRIGKIKDAGQC